MGRVGLKGEDKAPPKNAIDFVADFLELLCLDSEDDWAGFADLKNARELERDTGGSGEESLSSLILGMGGGGILAEQVDEGVVVDEGDEPARLAADEVDDPEAGAVEEEPPLLSDAELSDVHQHLEHRASILEEAYPFTVSDEGLQRQELTPARRLYAALLICSCQKYIPDADCPPWRTFFERFGRHVLKAYFGDRATVDVFGTGALEGETYHGDTREALQRLAADLNLDVLARADDLGPQGDFGLDLVAKLRFDTNDAADLQLAVLAQCGTGKDWRDKQEEASTAQWGRILSEANPIQSALLIPYFWRKSTGDWLRPSRVHKTNVLFDRQRIMFLAGDEPPLDEAPGLLAALN